MFIPTAAPTTSTSPFSVLDFRGLAEMTVQEALERVRSNEYQGCRKPGSPDIRWTSLVPGLPELSSPRGHGNLERGDDSSGSPGTSEVQRISGLPGLRQPRGNRSGEPATFKTSGQRGFG